VVFCRQQAHDLGLDLGRLARRELLRALSTATRQHQQRGDAHHQSFGLHVAPSNPLSRGNHTINGMAQAMTLAALHCSP
jgi:hypothetical protein